MSPNPRHSGREHTRIQMRTTPANTEHNLSTRHTTCRREPLRVASLSMLTFQSTSRNRLSNRHRRGTTNPYDYRAGLMCGDIQVHPAYRTPGTYQADMTSRVRDVIHRRLQCVIVSEGHFIDLRWRAPGCLTGSQAPGQWGAP